MKLTLLLGLGLMLAGCSKEAPPPGGSVQEVPPPPARTESAYYCVARVQHIEYHGDREHGGDWYIVVLESPEHRMWTIKILYSYPPIWEGLVGEMKYTVQDSKRGEYKNLVVLRRIE